MSNRKRIPRRQKTSDDVWKTWAARRIEHRLAVACGQPESIEAATLQSIAEEINDGVFYNWPGWSEIRSKYIARGPEGSWWFSKNGEHILAAYIRDDLEHGLKQRQEQRKEWAAALAELERTGHWPSQSKPSSPLLPTEKARLVMDNLGLIGKFARSIAKGNQVLLSELENIGQRVLEEQARKFDRTRNVKFETFASHRLRGAMIDYVRASSKNRAVAVGGAKEVNIASQYYKERLGPKTWDDANYRRRRVRQYLRDGKVKDFAWRNGAGYRLVPSGDMAVIKRLLPRLNRRQQTVYRGMVLSEPPLSRATLARQLGIKDETQISRILRQAQRRMTAWLAESQQKPK
jgi:DNA-directed RNA polymerase specialized sigma subunit